MPHLRRALLVAIFAGSALGGVCGSVLRRYEPLDWPIGATGARERDFGTLHLAVWGLIRQTGGFQAVASNRGSAPITVSFLELEIDGEVERWTPEGGVLVIAPGADAEIRASFTPPDDNRPRVLIDTSEGPISMELELP